MGQRHSTAMSACCGGMAAPEQAACPPTPAAQPTPAAPPDDVLPTNSQRLEVAGSGDSAPAPDSPAARSLAAVPNSPAAPLLATLPDDLLVACFEQLEDPLERCARQPGSGPWCVSAEWWYEAAGAPSLLLPLLPQRGLAPPTAICALLHHPAAGAACCRWCAPAGAAWQMHLSLRAASG